MAYPYGSYSNTSPYEELMAGRSRRDARGRTPPPSLADVLAEAGEFLEPLLGGQNPHMRAIGPGGIPSRAAVGGEPMSAPSDQEILREVGGLLEPLLGGQIGPGGIPSRAAIREAASAPPAELQAPLLDAMEGQLRSGVGIEELRESHALQEEAKRVAANNLAGRIPQRHQTPEQYKAYMEGQLGNQWWEYHGPNDSDRRIMETQRNSKGEIEHRNINMADSATRLRHAQALKADRESKAGADLDKARADQLRSTIGSRTTELQQDLAEVELEAARQALAGELADREGTKQRIAAVEVDAKAGPADGESSEAFADRIINELRAIKPLSDQAQLGKEYKRLEDLALSLLAKQRSKPEAYRHLPWYLKHNPLMPNIMKKQINEMGRIKVDERQRQESQALIKSLRGEQ